jgi:hypothetical protein
MTTLAQIKRVTRPLLERNPDLALVGRLIVIKPVHHLICGVHFGGSNPTVFRPTWIVNFLFKPDPCILAIWEAIWGALLPAGKGWKPDFTKPRAIHVRIGRLAAITRLPPRERRYPKSWNMWDANDPMTAAKMCKVFEQKALPMLRNLRSIDDFVAFTADEARFPLTYLGSNYFNEPFVYAAQGDFAAAVATATKVERASKRESIRELLPLMTAGDRSGVAKLLHGWEADSVRRLQLGDYWQPTPFPVET